MIGGWQCQSIYLDVWEREIQFPVMEKSDELSSCHVIMWSRATSSILLNWKAAYYTLTLLDIMVHTQFFICFRYIQQNTTFNMIKVIIADSYYFNIVHVTEHDPGFCRFFNTDLRGGCPQQFMDYKILYPLWLNLILLWLHVKKIWFILVCFCRNLGKSGLRVSCLGLGE